MLQGLSCIRKNDLAVIFSGAVFSISLLSAFFIPVNNRAIQDKFLPEVVRIFLIRDSSSQIRGHIIALILVALFWIIGFVYSKIMAKSESPAVGTLAQPINFIRWHFWILLLPLCVFSAMNEEARDPNTGAISIFLSVLLMVAFLSNGKYCSTDFLRFKIWPFLFIYLSFFLIPGLIKSISLIGLDSPQMESHYIDTVAQADRFVSGQLLFRDFILNYGFILSPAVGYLEREYGMWTFGNYVRFVQALQVLFCILTLICYYLWRPHNPLYLIVAMLMVTPWISTSNYIIFFPNETAWRFMGFPLGSLVLLILRRKSNLISAFVLGLCSGLLILYNQETGIAITAGYIAFITLRVDTFTMRNMATAYSLFIAGVVCSLILWLTMFRSLMGYWPLPIVASQSFDLGTKALGGFLGKQLYLDVLAATIFFHAIYVVIRSGMIRSIQQISFSGSFRVAIGVTILVWFAYYANRPTPWNLWTYILLYGFLIPDYLDRRILAPTWSGLARWRVPVHGIVLWLVILPYLIATNAHEAKFCISRFLAKLPQDAKILSGVWYPGTDAEFTLEKVRFLISQPDPSNLLYFTSDHPFLIPHLAGIYSRSLELKGTYSEHSIFVKKIVELSPSRVLFEIRNESLLSRWSVERHNLLNRLKTDLNGYYCLRAITGGWEIWDKVSPSFNCQ